MEFIKESVKEKITNWNEWINTYIYQHSELYKNINLMLLFNPIECNTAGEIMVLSPYRIWIELLRSSNIKTERIRFKLIVEI